YYIYDDNAVHIRHVGFVAEVPASESEYWITADGGQKVLNKAGAGGQAAHFSKNPWKLMQPDVKKEAHAFAKPPPDILVPRIGSTDYGGMVDSGRLIGWVDVDEVDMINNGAFDAHYNEQRYHDAGAMIGILRGS